MRRSLRVLICLLSILPGETGARERFWPQRERWREAALGALRHPGTWVPAGGAVVFWGTGWDDNLAEWAVSETPIFHSRGNAQEASNNMLTAGHAAMTATAFLAPVEKGCCKEALKTVAIGGVGSLMTLAVTSGLKEATDRQRPDRTSDDSFPSGHASLAFAAAAASSRNLGASRLSRPAKNGLRIALHGLAAGTAWARIEAGVHFPTDVLAGAALGNFVSLLVHDAFLEGRDDFQMMLGGDAHGGTVTLRWAPGNLRRKESR